MSHTILLTGASGYLGGSLLDALPSANLPPYKKLYALVRTDEQAQAVQAYGAEPLSINLSSSSSIEKAIVENQITIVLYLIDALGSHVEPFITALAKLKQQTGKETHFLFTSGAKIFSSHAGAPTDKPLLDIDPDLFAIQKKQVESAPHDIMKTAVRANNTVVSLSKELGVKSYIFAPCIVYGPGTGFGNKISIQTVAIVKAARVAGGVYRVDAGKPTWPVCHVQDTVGLYAGILRGVLEGRDIGYGESGYFLAASGSVAWIDIYEAMAKALHKKGVVESSEVRMADETVRRKMAEGIECPKELVEVQVGGMCTFTAEHGKGIGWAPKFGPEDILEKADEEVEFILKNLKG